MVAKALSSIKEALPAGVELVAVSKFHPVDRLMEAYNAGQRIFAESRPQELAAKVPEMPSDVRWHFIGHLQTNKLKLVLPYVDLVQSVDSLHLLEAINAWGIANNKVTDILLELHLGAEETKQGFTEAEILSLLSSQLVLDTKTGCLVSGRAKNGMLDTKTGCLVSGGGVRIRGLMGMATNTDDMEVVEKDFERIERLFLEIKEMEIPGFEELSIGMSGDWPVAVRHHATMVRIGTDIFGPREY